MTGVNMLDLYKLEIFNTVAIEGSFSRAAARMSLSQPAVSQHMRDLETSLDVELFVRGYRGVTLTASGETLLDYTRCILRLLGEAESAIRHLNQLEAGQIALGATPGAGVYLLPGWMQTFHERFPNLATSLRTDTTSQILRAIREKEIAIGFVEGEFSAQPPLRSQVLRDIDLFVVVYRGHAWWSRQVIQLDELAGQAFISRPIGSHTRAWIDQALNNAGVQARIVAEFDNPEAIKQAVASGMGITILPEWGLQEQSAGHDLRSLPVQGVDLRRTLKLVWNEEAPFKPAARAFLALLMDDFPQLTQLVTFEDSLEVALPRREVYRASLICTDERSSSISAKP
jgi:DNA-binding transcriptional LysR family regulator